MVGVMRAIRQALREASSLAYIRDADIFAAPHINFIPGGVKEYFIGVKDGPSRRRELTCGMTEVTADVHLCCWVRIADYETSVIGEESSVTRGALEVARDVAAVLKDNRLGIKGMQAALLTAEPPSDLFVSDTGTSYQRKMVTLTYTWEE